MKNRILLVLTLVIFISPVYSQKKSTKSKKSEACGGSARG